MTEAETIVRDATVDLESTIYPTHVQERGDIIFIHFTS